MQPIAKLTMKRSRDIPLPQQRGVMKMNKNVFARSINGRFEFHCAVCNESVAPDLPISQADLHRFGDLFAEEHGHLFLGRDTDLIPYIAYSKSSNPATDMPVLVFANGVMTGKHLAFRAMDVDYDDLDILELCGDSGAPSDFLLLGDHEKLANNEPHVVMSSATCRACGKWGSGIDENMKCNNCSQSPGDELLALLGGA